MQGRKPAGQEGSEPPEAERTEARGDDEIAAAIRGGAPTDSHPVAEAGFDTNLPDDADDVAAGAAAPVRAPQVGADEQVIPGKKRRVLRSRGHGGPRRSPPAG